MNEPASKSKFAQKILFVHTYEKRESVCYKTFESASNDHIAQYGQNWYGSENGDAWVEFTSQTIFQWISSSKKNILYYNNGTITNHKAFILLIISKTLFALFPLYCLVLLLVQTISVNSDLKRHWFEMGCTIIVVVGCCCLLCLVYFNRELYALSYLSMYLSRYRGSYHKGFSEKVIDLWQNMIYADELSKLLCQLLGKNIGSVVLKFLGVSPYLYIKNGTLDEVPWQ